MKPGALVISIGSSQLPAGVIHGPRLVATTWESLASRQPYASAVKDGKYSKSDIAAELGAVVLKEASARTHLGETVVFELTRINLWSVAVAYTAYQWAVGEGIGTPFTLGRE